MIVIDTSKTQWCDADHQIFNAYIKDVDGWKYITCCKYSTGTAGKIWDMRDELDIIPAENEQTDEALIKLVQLGIQQRLDYMASLKEYDDAASVVSYLGSTDPTFRAQAEKFNAWRDACWATARKIREDVKAGKIARPTYAEVMALIPSFEWDH